MLDVFFADDSRQDTPTRPGMGPLVATGFLHVPSCSVRDLEHELRDLCRKTGFPAGSSGEFKWSPGRDLWMHRGLVGEQREDFFALALSLAEGAGCTAVVVVADRNRGTATQTQDHEADVATLLLERVEKVLESRSATGLVVVDRPPGGRKSENQFLQNCLETLSSGTAYVLPERIAVNVVSTPSSLVRCLQLSDVITSRPDALLDARISEVRIRRLRQSVAVQSL